jgi:tetratricopeptide (TPR) repeat protein
VLEGTIDRIGKGYSIALRVVDADTARVILATSGAAKDEDALIPLLGHMAKRLRHGLGENQSAIQATRDMKLIMTPSFEAYRLYVQAGGKSSVRAKLRVLRAALSLDPDFASAWLRAGSLYYDIFYPDSAEMCYAEALRRPDRLTPRQRETVDLDRAIVAGDFGRVLAQCDRILADDPTDLLALHASNEPLWFMGRYDEVLRRDRLRMQLSPFGPDEGQRWIEALALLSLGRFDEAREANQRMTGSWKAMTRAGIELAAGRFAAAESIATAGLDDPRLLDDLPDGLHWWLAASRFGRGALVDAAAAAKSGAEACRLARDRVGIEGYRRTGIEFSVVSDGALPLPADEIGRDTTAEALLTRGLRAAVLRDEETARRCLAATRRRPARELRRESLTPLLLEAQIAAIAGRPEKTVGLLRPLATTADGQGVSLSWVHWWLADAFEHMARPDSAAFYLERPLAVAYGGNDGADKPFLQWRLVMLYARIGRASDAERHLAALEQAWDRPDPEIRRRLDKARAAVRAARGMNPAEPPRKG